MNGKITIALFLIARLILAEVFAQNNKIRFNQVLGDKGKPLLKINAISQDPHGYMWFGGVGAGCLYRYDGIRITSYKQDSLNPNSLAVTYPETIYADDEGLIWIGGNGLDQFNPATGIFKHYRHDEKDSGSFSGKGVSFILRDHKGRVWVGTEGLDCLDEKTGKFIHYRNDPKDSRSLSSNEINVIYEDHKGVIWIGTGTPWFHRDPEDGGLNRLKPDGSFTRFMHDPENPHSLINNKVRGIFEDSRGIFWVGTSGDGLHTMDREKGSFERHPYNPSHPDQLSRPPLHPNDLNDPITFIQEDGAGAIWIATENSGINRYDTVTKKITHYEYSNGFPDGSGWRACTSRDGVLWFGTEQGHLFRVDPFQKTLDSITTGQTANCFFEGRDGSLWVGTDGNGLLHYDHNRKLLQQFKYDSSKPAGLFSNLIVSCFQKKGDSIWLGTFDDGIGVFNTLTQKFSKFRYDGTLKDTGISNPVFAIAEDGDGNKWFARPAGLVRYNPRDGSTKTYHPDAKDPGSISSDRVSSVLIDRSGDLWVSAWGDNGINKAGINRLNRQTGQFMHYLEGHFIPGMYEDEGGNIWARSGNNLYRMGKEQDSFALIYTLRPSEGITDIRGIIEDRDRNLWLRTTSAILKLNPETKELYTFGSRVGIEPATLDGGFYKTREGEILVGVQKGFYHFFPEELVIRKPPLKVMITDLFINNLPVMPGKMSSLSKPLEDIGELIFDHDQNTFAFNFAAVDYRDPESTQYFTLLENYDNDWREALYERGSSYNNVPPGKYVYHVKAINSDGTAAEKIITIHIKLPWWQTWWAYGIYGLLLIMAGLGIYRMQKQRIVRAEREKAHAKELVQAKEIEKAYRELKTTQGQLIQSEKMASLGELTAGIAHEIQNPLNFVNNFSEVNKELLEEMKNEMENGNLDEAKAMANNVIENEEKINHHGRRADAIVKSMLQHSRTSTGQKEPTDINALADEYLRLAYHGLRAKDKSFNVSLKTDFDEAIGKLKLVPQDIGRVLLNLYNNSFYALNEKMKQASPGFEPIVTVSTKKLDKMVELRVKDNGNGIPQKILDKIFQPFFTTKPAGQGTGLGLSLSYDVITKSHGGTLKVETAEGEGTTFIIQLPLS